MTPINWTALALADLRAIDAWLSREVSSAFASHTLNLIGAKSDLLGQFPHSGRAILKHNFRALRVIDTPYLIVYRINAASIDILRLRHEREDWQVRP